MLVACFFLGKGIAGTASREKGKMGKPELSLDTEWVCVIVGRLQVGPPFRRTLSSQSRRLSCRGRRPERTTRDQKEPAGTNEPWTFRDYPIIAEVLGLEENMSKTQSGVKIQSKSQSQSTKLMMMYLVLAVVTRPSKLCGF